MIMFYPTWVFLNKTEDGKYLYKSPYNNGGCRTIKSKDFSIFEKIYKEYTEEEYPSVKIIKIRPRKNMGYEYIIESSYTYEELKIFSEKQFQLLRQYKKDKRVSKGLLEDLIFVLEVFGKIYLNE